MLDKIKQLFQKIPLRKKQLDITEPYDLYNLIWLYAEKLQIPNNPKLLIIQKKDLNIAEKCKKCPYNEGFLPEDQKYPNTRALICHSPDVVFGTCYKIHQVVIKR